MAILSDLRQAPAKGRMKTRFKFIHFVEAGPDARWDGRYWSCRNNKSAAELGIVFSYSPWKQNVFQQTEQAAIFSADCLRDIAAFMEGLK